MSILSERRIQEWIGKVGKADLLIGIPSYNNARTIGHVVQSVQAGLAKYFPGQRAVIINSDGGSKDGTMEVVEQTTIQDFQSLLLHHHVHEVHKISTPYHGILGKGSAFKAIFEIADALQAKACAVVDSDLRSITPEWIELLIKPQVHNGFDFVAPLYQRHKYDGTITNSIVYPLTRALYGKRIRQPIGGDFGFNGKLARFYLGKDVWETDVARFGIDTWMTTTAIANRFEVCQAFLGAKIHNAKDPASDLSSMLYQVVSAAFDLMEIYPGIWHEVVSSRAVPTFGFRYEVGLEPVVVNLEGMVERFRLGVKELSQLWEAFLSPEVMHYLRRTATYPANKVRIIDEIWVEIIYSFALACHRKVMTREHLLKSLTPLYIGRVASFVQETQTCDAQAVEEKIEHLCLAFETQKEQLVRNW